MAETGWEEVLGTTHRFHSLPVPDMGPYKDEKGALEAPEMRKLGSEREMAVCCVAAGGPREYSTVGGMVVGSTRREVVLLRVCRSMRCFLRAVGTHVLLDEGGGGGMTGGTEEVEVDTVVGAEVVVDIGVEREEEGSGGVLR